MQTAAAKARWSCIREPVIPTQAALHTPDLVCHYPERATFVLDITIVADNAVLEDAHSHKVWYYDVADIRYWISHNVSGSAVNFSSVTLNWRGLMACASAETLCVDGPGVTDPESSVCCHL